MDSDKNQDGLGTLARNLVSWFSPFEFEQFVRSLPDGIHLAAELPVGASLARSAFELVALLNRRGLLNTDFFLTLINARPNMSDQINVLIQLCKPGIFPAAVLTPGTLLNSGRYRIDEQVGFGSFAAVWRAYDNKTKGVVAIKVLRRDVPPTEYAVRRSQFIRGVEHIVRISHPNIAQVVESHRVEMGYDYCVLEFVDGISLADRILRGASPMSLEHLFRVICNIGSALAEIHANGVVHGDISPRNIILQGESCRLVDFDFVSRCEELPLTSSGVPGTDPYTAPESKAPPEAVDVDARADVFSLGMTVVFAVYGRELPAGLNDQRVGRPAEFIGESVPCSNEIKSVLIKACALDRVDRYRTMDRFCYDLQESASGNSEVLRRAELPRPPLRNPARSLWERRVDIIASTLTGLAVCAFVVFVYFQVGSPTEQKRKSLWIETQEHIRVAKISERWSESSNLLIQAAWLEHHGNAVAALAAYQTILALDPTAYYIKARIQTLGAPRLIEKQAVPDSDKATRIVHGDWSKPSIIRAEPRSQACYGLTKECHDIVEGSRLLVDASPGGLVFIDGFEAGTTPVDVEAGVGAHVLRVEAFGYEPYAVELDLGRGPQVVVVEPKRTELYAKVMHQLKELFPWEPTMDALTRVMQQMPPRRSINSGN